MTKKANFNTIAPFYDLLVRLVFGKKLLKAQSLFLDHLNPEDMVLVFGGGTGKILQSIFHHAPAATVYYLESSEKMLDLAKARNFQLKHQIQFIRQTDMFFESNIRQFDAIITPFVLDVFEDQYLSVLMNNLNNCLRAGGVWLHTDFYLDQNSQWWQRALVGVMYKFFWMTTNLKNQRLPDFYKQFNQSGLILKQQTQIMSNLVKAQVYQKAW